MEQYVSFLFFGNKGSYDEILNLNIPVGKRP